MAGGICHEMNQPLQIILLYTEMLLANVTTQDPNYENALMIQDGVKRLGDITRHIMNITQVRTHEYLDPENQIIDLAQSQSSSPYA
jgi:signal transduction histidine kinase